MSFKLNPLLEKASKQLNHENHENHENRVNYIHNTYDVRSLPTTNDYLARIAENLDDIAFCNKLSTITTFVTFIGVNVLITKLLLS